MYPEAVEMGTGRLINLETGQEIYRVPLSVRELLAALDVFYGMVEFGPERMTINVSAGTKIVEVFENILFKTIQARKDIDRK